MASAPPAAHHDPTEEEEEAAAAPGPSLLHRAISLDSKRALDAELLRPFQYIRQLKGKQMRRKLIALLRRPFFRAVSDAHADVVADIIEDLHNASLMIDDIEDASLVRRGVSAAHVVYGVASTLNSANLVYFLAIEKARQALPHAALAVLLEEMVNLHRGQGLDIHWRDTHTCPSFVQYRYMATHKTGGLFRLLGRMLGACEEEQKEKSERGEDDIVAFLEELGLLFQLRDDYINLACTQYQSSKGFCEDLSEGKFSFPVLCVLLCLADQDPRAQRLREILHLRTQDKAVKQEALNIIREVGAFEATVRAITEVRDKVRAKLAALTPEGDPGLEAMIAMLSRGVTTTTAAAAAGAAGATGLDAQKGRGSDPAAAVAQELPFHLRGDAPNGADAHDGAY